jgi:drug/metabolite transporter (DMT)-like permease
MASPWDGSTPQQSSESTASLEHSSSLLSPSSPPVTAHRLLAIYQANKSIALMLLAQLFSSLMAVSSKLLQTRSCHPLSTAQVLLSMMTLTSALCWLHMLVTRVPHAPLGPSALWPLLHLRGIAGVFGIAGFYYSLRYLPLAEATVINFLAPMVAAATSTLLHGTRWGGKQQLAGAVSVVGVLLVSQPWRIFTTEDVENDTMAPARTDTLPQPPGWANATFCTNCTSLSDLQLAMQSTASGPAAAAGVPSSFQQATALLAALVGVCGGATAFVAMQRIGPRTHPVVTVNYFSTWAALLSGCFLALAQRREFRWPSCGEAALLCFLGVCGLGLHLLMTKSLAGEKSNRALGVVYSQIVFALAWDGLVWGQVPGGVKVLGGVLILGSVVAVAMAGDGQGGGEGDCEVARKGEKRRRGTREAHDEEEIEMMVPKELGRETS